VNEVEGVVRSGSVVTPVGRFAASGLAEGAAAVAAIRPQGIELSPAGEGHAAKVAGRHFLGEVDHVELIVDGLDVPIMARTRANGHVSVGAEVGLRIHPEDVLIFAKSGV
jgi:iron(III) transport system ATP-binding protein